MSATRWLFWAALWLALLLVAVKASYLGVPHWSLNELQTYIQSLAAISYDDVLFAGIVWACARIALVAAGPWRLRVVAGVFVLLAAVSAVYAIVNVVVFGVFGGFLTYALIELVGNVRMLSSSVAAYVTPRIVAGLLGLPLGYLAIVWASVRFGPQSPRAWRQVRRIAAACLLVWLALGYYAYAATWRTKQERRIAENSHWVLLSSWLQAITGEGTARMPETFAAADLLDFQAPGSPATTAVPSGQRPLNVILVVLESVAARWSGLNGGLYAGTMPVLTAEAAHGITFENAYAQIGRSSDSLAAILMSVYPKLDFRDITEEYPALAGTSLVSVFHDRGYRTAFYEPSDLTWAAWDAFLTNRGFDELHDYHSLACPDMISSWGVEDRCMVDGMLDFIKRDPAKPFFLMGWTVQTHHPYEPTPGVPMLDLLKGEPGPDSYDLGRYLNVLHETDRHLGRLLDGVRQAGLANDTLVVFVGDHGQAFGYPHDSYMQGRTAYEEDVHVPLLMWLPGRYQAAARSKTIGGHVDLAPTIAALAGIPPAPAWEGHNLLDPGHMPRAYFFVAEDHFKLAVREDNWKYIFDLREGVEELYDLDRDPNEQHNLAAGDPQRCARLRQRLAAWTEANRRHYQKG